MQPYQRSAEAIRSGEEYPLQVLKNLGLTAIGGGTAFAGSKIASKLVPAIGALINSYVPDNIMDKGLKNIDPRFGKLISGALEGGYTYDDLRNFLGEKLQQSEQPKENRNVIEQYSPELHQFLSEKIKGGEDPIRAAALALFKEGNSFQNIIRKIENDHKTNWSQLVQSIYGGPGQAQQSVPQQMQSQTPQAAPQQGAGGGQGQQALMAILQKINQRLGP